MTHDLHAARDRKLTRGDAHISRCPSCGSWTWRGTCPIATEHQPTKESA